MLSFAVLVFSALPLLSPFSLIFVTVARRALTLHFYRYQVFWITLFACKFTCSFLFQIRPLIYPTIQLLSDPSHQNHLFPYSQYILLVTLWLPFWFIYMIDLSVWYSIWSAGVGAFVGVYEKLGEVFFQRLRICVLRFNIFCICSDSLFQYDSISFS